MHGKAVNRDLKGIRYAEIDHSLCEHPFFR